mmetsp:Transcript_138536/g.386452  ORF Transcript_138536/g.386452 Transcript_138536/m.386452 type:complete len:244 (+) Transcript_138536:89-820(+)
MSDRAAKWQQQFQKGRAAMAQVHAELQQWEQLAHQAGAADERGQRGAQIRARVSELKLDLERLQRELTGLSDQHTAQEVCEVGQAMAELQELSRRAKGLPGTNGTAAPSKVPASSTGGLFVRLGGDDKRQASSGAELQPVSRRAMLEQQQRAMRDMDEQAVPQLECAVSNVRQVANMIGREIRSQNSMLVSLNEDFDRTQSRMGRARTLLARLGSGGGNRRLLCSVVMLMAALIALFLYIMGV